MGPSVSLSGAKDLIMPVRFIAIANRLAGDKLFRSAQADKKAYC